MQLSEISSSNFPIEINIIIISKPLEQEQVGIPIAPIPVPWSPLQESQLFALLEQAEHWFAQLKQLTLDPSSYFPFLN